MPKEVSEASQVGKTTERRKRKSGIPTGNAGEYFVMGELLKRGYDAQLADRNTKGYDVLVGLEKDKELRKVQVKSVRDSASVRKCRRLQGDSVVQTTIYVLVGSADSKKPVRYFVAKNSDLVQYVKQPAGWRSSAFMPLKALQQFEDNWAALQ